MRKTLTVIGFAAATALATVPAQADEERVEHYQGKPAANLEQAVRNLREYNRKLEQRLSQELTGEDMHEIHKLSYTLENALKRLDADLDRIADVLEGMHLASERGDRDAVEDNARTYLKNAGMIVGKP